MNSKGIKTITLTTNKTQLSLVILESGHVSLGYFGERLPESDLSYVISEIVRASYMADTDGINDFKLEQIPLIYPSFGNPDMRNPAHQESHADGSRLADFRYSKHTFSKEKIPVSGMPYASHDNQQILTLFLIDKVTGNELQIQITAFRDHDVFTQSVKYFNHQETRVTIHSMLSLNLDFLTDQFEMLTLSGAWGRENHLNRRKIFQGTQGINSKRGASGHGQNPFLALVSPETDDDHGLIIAANLVYSGNFIAEVEVDMHQNSRMQVGINPFEFGWKLNPGESFQTPEVVFLSTEEGLNAMSQRFHRFYQDCLIQSPYREIERPVLINNWEATYFDFDHKKIIDLVEESQKLGIELFVLDDGWFGKRDDDTSSLGDWHANEEKLGGTLSQLADEIHHLGLKFGLWVEPEMISQKSNLFEQHPDWAIQVPDRTPQLVRNQYVLDLTRIDVQEYLICELSKLFESTKIDYVKWDMNRNITDSYSAKLSTDRQQEFSHRYILGLYRVLDKLTKSFPEILFEGCAGGGGRCDPGMLYYMPQTWISDDTDAIARLEIQAGTALLYPPITMGCHVSAVPNHQVGRFTSLETRASIAQQGNFGYELDVLSLSDEEKKLVKKQIQKYKKQRSTLQFGIQTRLNVYDSSNEYAWQKENQRTGELIVTHVNILTKPNTVPKRLKLKKLDPTAIYSVNGIRRSALELMKIGLMVEKPNKDFYVTTWILNKLEEEDVNFKAY